MRPGGLASNFATGRSRFNARSQHAGLLYFVTLLLTSDAFTHYLVHLYVFPVYVFPGASLALLRRRHDTKLRLLLRITRIALTRKE